MDNITQEILKVKRTRPGLEWRDVATIVNYACGSDLSANAARKRFDKETKSQRPNTPHYEGKQYKTLVDLRLHGNTMFISDTHAPFVIKGAIDFLLGVYRKYNIQNVFHMGDVVDEYALSFYDKLPEADNIVSEHAKAKAFVKELSEAFPVVYGVLGNHDNRYQRVAAKAGLPQSFIRSFEEILEMPEGWNFEQSYILNGSILIEHGAASGMRATYDRALMTSMNCVGAHTHNYGGVMYINDGFKQRWALNVGTLADSETYAMKYAVDRKYQHTMGCGVLVDGIPHFIPYLYNKG